MYLIRLFIGVTHIRKLLTFIFSIFYLLPLCSQTEVKYKNFDDLLFQSEDAFYNENYSKALVYFDTLAKIDTAQLNYYHYHIGLCYLYSNIDNNKILEYLEPAVHNLAGSFLIDLVYFNLGKAYQVFYRFDDAIEAYRKSLELDKTRGSPEFVSLVQRHIEMCLAGKEIAQKPANVEIKNLGNRLNSTFPEYKPVISNDESSLFFTSKRNSNKGGELDKSGNYYEDIFITGRNDFGNWVEPVHMSDAINTKRHEASIELLDSGTTLLLYKGSGSKNGLFFSKYDGQRWLPPKMVNNKLNSEYKASSASISSDGKTMYFVSEKKDGFGGKDIYKVEKNSGGEWSDPENLGSIINTLHDEESPFIDYTGKILYFSSKGHNSIGGFDIFRAKLENKTWDKPENLGLPINSTSDDVHFRLTANNRRAYYASSNTGGLGMQDIYQVTFAGFSSPYKIIRGKILTDKNPAGAKIIVKDIADKNLVNLVFQPDSAGNFLMFLEPDRKYEMFVFAKGFLGHKFNFRVPLVHEKGTLPFYNQQVILRSLNVFGKTIGEECSVINAFAISESDAFDSSVSRTDILNKDYLDVLHELTLSSATSEIENLKITSGFSEKEKIPQALAFRKNKLMRITDPDMNRLYAAIEKNSSGKFSNLILPGIQKSPEFILTEVDGEKVRTSPANFNRAPNYDYGNMPGTIRDLIVNHLNKFLQENGELSYYSDVDLPEIISKLIHGQQNVRVIKNSSPSELASVTAVQLSELVKMVFAGTFSDELTGIDSLGLSKLVNTQSLGLSDSQIVELFSSPVLVLNSFMITKKIDISLEWILTKWMDVSSFSGNDSAVVADIVKKQIAYMIISQLDSHNKLLLMKQKLTQLISLKIQEAVKLHLDSLDFIVVAGIDSNILVKQMKNTLDNISGQSLKENSLVKALAVNDNELAHIARREFAETLKNDLLSLKIQRFRDEILRYSITADHVLFKGNITTEKGLNIPVKIFFADSASQTYEKYVAFPDADGNYFMLLEPGKTYEMFVSADKLYTEKIMFRIPPLSIDEIPYHFQKVFLKSLKAFGNNIGQEFIINNSFNIKANQFFENPDSASVYLEFLREYLFLLEDRLKKTTDSLAVSAVRNGASDPFKAAYLAFNDSVFFGLPAYSEIKKTMAGDRAEIKLKNEIYGNGYSNINFIPPAKFDTSVIGRDTVFSLPQKYFPVDKNDVSAFTETVSVRLREIVHQQSEKISDVAMSRFCADVLRVLWDHKIAGMPLDQRDNAILDGVGNVAENKLAAKPGEITDVEILKLAGIIVTQLDAQKRKMEAEQKLGELTRLSILQKINTELGKVNLLEISEIDNEKLVGIIVGEIENLNKEIFSGLTPAQKEELKMVDMKDVLKRELAVADLSGIRGQRITEMIAASDYGDRMIIRGNLLKEGNFQPDALTRIILVDRSTNEIVPYVINPGSYGDFMLFPEEGKEYDMIIEVEGTKPQKLRLNLSGAKKLGKLPLVQHQLVLKTVDAFNETIGQELLFYSFESPLKGDSAEIQSRTNLLAMDMHAFLSSVDSVSKAKGITDPFEIYKITNSRGQIEKAEKIFASPHAEILSRNNLLERTYSSGVSNLSIYKPEDEQELIPIVAGKDTIYTLPEFFKRAAGYDYKKLSLIMTFVMHQQNVENLEAEIMRDIIRNTYLLLQNNNSLNPSLMQLTDEKLKAVISENMLDAIKVVKEENLRKRELELKLAEIAELRLLNAISVKMDNMDLHDIASLDSAGLFVLLEEQVSAMGKANFPELALSKKFTDENVRIIVKGTLANLKPGEIEKMKQKKIIQMMAAGNDTANAFLVLQGKINVDSGKPDHYAAQLKIIDPDGRTIKYFKLNPDGTYLALLEPGKDYHMVVTHQTMLPELIRLRLSEMKNLSGLPLLYQQISLVPVTAFDEVIGQHIFVNNGDQSVLTNTDSSKALSAISIYGSEKKVGLVPVQIESDTVYAISDKYRKPANFDYRSLSQIITSLRQMAELDTMSKTNLIAMLQQSRLFEAQQLSQIILTVELMDEKNFMDKSSMADIVAKTMIKLYMLNPDMMELQKLEEMADIKLEEVLRQKAAAVDKADSNSVIANATTLIMNVQLEENKKRDSLMLKFSDLSRLYALEKINFILSQLPVQAFADLDSNAILEMLRDEISAMQISGITELQGDQKDYLEKSGARDFVMRQIEHFSLKEIETIKNNSLAERLGKSGTDKRILVRGKLIDKDLPGNTELTVIEKISRNQVSDFFKPDSFGNYYLLLDPEKEYDMIVNKRGYVSERYKLTISGDRKLAALPVIYQQIEIKPVLVYNEKIGQEILIANSESFVDTGKEVLSNINIYTSATKNSMEPVVSGKDTFFVMPQNFISVRGKYSHLPQQISSLLLLNEQEITGREELLELINLTLAELKNNNVAAFTDQQLNIAISESIESRKQLKASGEKAAKVAFDQSIALLEKQINLMDKNQLLNADPENLAALIIAEVRKNKDFKGKGLMMEKLDSIIKEQVYRSVKTQMHSLADARIAKIDRLELKKADDNYLASLNSDKMKSQAKTPSVNFMYETVKKKPVESIAMEIPVSPDSLLIAEKKRETVRKDSLMRLPEEKLFTVYFDYDKYDPLNKEIPELQSLIAWVKNLADYRIEISGHTDSKGSDNYNLVLSKKRAASLASYLSSKGMKKNKIRVLGFGESKPVAPNSLIDGTDNPDGRRLNRRAEIKIKG